MGEHRVKNIAEPITVYRVNLERRAALEQDRASHGRCAAGRRPRLRWCAPALVPAGAWYGILAASAPPPAAVAESAGSAPAEAKPALPLPDKPSIAVLPFDNLSGEARYERLADGITEDIITDLSRFRDLFVIARNSTFVYKGKPMDVRQVARELGVRYVLEGSLQADGEQVRITAQLIDATTGNHVWSERYDRPLDDIFAVQDEVTQTIAGVSRGHVRRSGKRRAGGGSAQTTESLAAYELYLLGLEHKHRFTKEDNLKAQELARKAIELDPSFARAYVALAWTYNMEIDYGWTGSWQRSMDNWLAAIQGCSCRRSLGC